MTNVASPTTAINKKSPTTTSASKTPPTVALLSTRSHVHSRGSATRKASANAQLVNVRSLNNSSDWKDTASLANSGTVFDQKMFDQKRSDKHCFTKYCSIGSFIISSCVARHLVFAEYVRSTPWSSKNVRSQYCSRAYVCRSPLTGPNSSFSTCTVTAVSNPRRASIPASRRYCTSCGSPLIVACFRATSSRAVVNSESRSTS